MSCSIEDNCSNVPASSGEVCSSWISFCVDSSISGSGSAAFFVSGQKNCSLTFRARCLKIDFRINRRPRSLPKVSDKAADWERYIENRKSSVRCKVEHVFRIIKCQFGYKKTVYRGLMKNENRLYAMFACANLYALAIAGRKLSTT